MASCVRELSVNASRWQVSRTKKPKGKRKEAFKGGSKKRRRRRYNFGHLNNQRKCVCSQKCICGEPIVFRDSQLQTDPARTAVQMVHKSTSIEQHNKHLPAAGTTTVADRRANKCGDALKRLKRAVPVGFHWNSAMIVVCLRLVFNCVYKFHWTWTKAVHFASQSVQLRTNTVFKFANDYLDNVGNDNNIWPQERDMKVRGRGSATFIANHGKDKYSALKEV